MIDRLIRGTITLLGWLIQFLYAAQRVPVWRTFDGRVIPIRDRSDQHLINAIRVVQRGAEPQPVLVHLLREMSKRWPQTSEQAKWID